MSTEGTAYYQPDNPTCAHRVHTVQICTGSREKVISAERSTLATDEHDCWRCPHPQLDDADGDDRCVFHADVDVDADDLVSAFSAALRAADRADTRHETRRRKQFIDVSLDTLNLDDAAIRTTDNVPVDLRASTIGRLSARNAIIDAPVDIRGATVDTVVGTNARLSRLYGQYLTAERVIFDQATIQRLYLDHLNATRVRLFQADVTYVDASTDHVDYGNFSYADFNEAGFIGASFDLLTFFGARFESAYCNKLAATYLNFAFVQSWEIHFGGATITAATFEGTTVERAYFDDTTLDRGAFIRVEFDWARFRGAALGVSQFDGAAFETALFERATFDQAFSLTDAHIATLTLDLRNVRPRTLRRPYVDLRGATVETGTVVLDDQVNAVYDLETATVGDVAIDQRRGRAAPLRLLRIADTRFDQFDFGQLQDGEPVLDLARHDHTIHTLVRGGAVTIATGRAVQEAARELHSPLEGAEDILGATDIENRIDFEQIDQAAIPTDTLAAARCEADPTPTEALRRFEADHAASPPAAVLEKTYLEAKNGATAVGNGLTAGRFFQHEHRHRRGTYWVQLWSGDPERRLRPTVEWARSKFLAITCGYGEQPRNVVASSVAIIATFAAYYRLSPATASQAPSLSGALVFSIQSFITFLVGTPPQPSTFPLRVVSSVEGFLGGFFIALFVFALTRQVYR